MPESRFLLNNCIESANTGEDEQESAYNEPGMGLSTKSISKQLIGQKNWACSLIGWYMCCKENYDITFDFKDVHFEDAKIVS